MAGTTADKLARLQETKGLLQTRLEEKGVTVPAEATFQALADLVGDISTGYQIYQFGLDLYNDFSVVSDGTSNYWLTIPGGKTWGDVAAFVFLNTNSMSDFYYMALKKGNVLRYAYRASDGSYTGWNESIRSNSETSIPIMTGYLPPADQSRAYCLFVVQ